MTNWKHVVTQVTLRCLTKMTKLETAFPNIYKDVMDGKFSEEQRYFLCVFVLRSLTKTHKQSVTLKEDSLASYKILVPVSGP